MNNWWDDEIPNEALKERKRTITFGEPMFCLSLNQGGANVIIGGSQQVWKQSRMAQEKKQIWKIENLGE